MTISIQTWLVRRQHDPVTEMEVDGGYVGSGRQVLDDLRETNTLCVLYPSESLTCTVSSHL